MKQSTTKALPLRFLSAALALAGALAGCDDAPEGVARLQTEVGAGPCLLLECTSRVELIVRPTTGVAAAGRARACVDGRCLDRELGPATCAAGDLCQAGADGSYTIFVPLEGAGLDDAAGHVAALSLAGADGARAFSSAVEFTLAAVEPGGPGCGRCYQTSLVFGPPAGADPGLVGRPTRAPPPPR